jgi:hypothetical protein
MAIEKGLYSAPEGIDDEMMEEGAEVALDIEIVDPEMVTLDDGSVEITLIPSEGLDEPTEFGDNLAEFMSDNALSLLANDLVGLVDSDVDARKDWADTFVAGLDVLGFKYEERTDPWNGACGVFSTVH